MPTRSAPHSTLKQLPVYFYLITILIQFDCFDKSVCSQKALGLFLQQFMSIVMMNNDCHKYDSSMKFLLRSMLQ